MIFRRNTVSRRKGRSRQTFCLESLEPRALLAGDPIALGEALIISEFVSDSHASLLTRTRDGFATPFAGEPQAPDWIELMNVSDHRVDLAGMHLTDDPADLQKWTFPGGISLEPGGFLVVFASGDDIRDPSLDENGFLHTNFRLGSDGEYLALTQADGRIVHEFSPAYPAQRVDVSYAVPMQLRSFVDSDTPLEYLVPADDSQAEQWNRPGFSDPNVVASAAASPIGFDRGAGADEPGEAVGTADLVRRKSIEFARGSLIVLESIPFTLDGRVDQWSFHSETSNAITPLILKATGSEYEIVGVGRTRTSDGSGVQTFDFDVQVGSDFVEQTGYYFGFKDGDNLVDNAGVIRYDASEVDSIRRFNGPLSGHILPGEQLNGGRSFSRTFSVQATTRPRLAGPIHTDVDQAMDGSSTLYVRYPFEVDQLDDLKSLTLQLRYEDGFVAYLNGTEVARRNAPDTVHFDSTAPENRSLQDANQYEDLNISAFINSLVVGTNVLALHGLNDDATGPDFLLDARLFGVDIPAADSLGFASDSTPNATNGELFAELLSGPEFSHTRGIYDQPFSLALSVPNHPLATTYYTLDGTVPTPDNPSATQYSAPISIERTTNLRAASYQDGLLPSLIQTHTYVFLADVINQPTLQPRITQDPVWGPQLTNALLSLPTISLVTPNTISVGSEVPVSAELIFPDGTVGFQADVGITPTGSTSISYAKQSLRLSFRNIYGPSTLEYNLYDDPDGVTEFDQIGLRAGAQDSLFVSDEPTIGGSSYIRNRWANDRQLDMGQLAPRGRFVHVYLNGTYWGQYQMMERPSAGFMAAHLGGDKEDYDVFNSGRPIDGTIEPWQALVETVDDGYENVQQYLDAVNYADYMLLQFFGGNSWDWSGDRNWIAGRKRESGAGFQFFAWDSDNVLRRGAEADVVNYGGPSFLWTLNGGIQQYPEFLKLMAERAQLYFFDDGIFTDAKLVEQIDGLAAQIRTSMITEAARWGSGLYTPDNWEAAIQWIKDHHVSENGPGRAEIVIEQMRHAGLFPLSDRPEFTVAGQAITEDRLTAGESLAMQAPAGDIYYTLDGSDPWEDQPTVDYTSLAGPSAAARVFVPQDDSLHATWSQLGFDDSAWTEAQTALGYDTTNELLPLLNTNIQPLVKDVNASAYVRLPFQVDNPATFDTLRLDVQYDDGFVAYLNGVEVARRNAPDTVNWNSGTYLNVARRNEEVREYDHFDLSREKHLLRAGGNVLAIQVLNTAANNVDMLINPVLKAGIVTDAGIAPGARRYDGPLAVPANAVINARTLWGDSWSTLRTAATEPLPLRITEVMYHPAEPTPAEIAAGHGDADDFEFIELVNTSNGSIDLSNVRFVESVVGGETEGIVFDFGQGVITQLGPGDRVLVVENRAAFEFRYGTKLPVTGQWKGGLRNSSEQITLMDGERLLQQFTYQDSWHPATDGQGPSLEIIDEFSPNLQGWNEGGNWQPSAVLGGTPGTDSNLPLPGDSNGDGVFDSADLLAVLEAGEYEDGIPNNSTFESGDWNGDGDFTTEDLIYVLQFGHYVMAPKVEALSRAAVSAALAADEVKDSLNSRDRLFEQMAEDDFLLTT